MAWIAVLTTSTKNPDFVRLPVAGLAWQELKVPDGPIAPEREHIERAGVLLWYPAGPSEYAIRAFHQVGAVDRAVRQAADVGGIVAVVPDQRVWRPTAGKDEG